MPRGNNRPQRFTKMIATRVDEETYNAILELVGSDSVGEWVRKTIIEVVKNEKSN